MSARLRGPFGQRFVLPVLILQSCVGAQAEKSAQEKSAQEKGKQAAKDLSRGDLRRGVTELAVARPLVSVLDTVHASRVRAARRLRFWRNARLKIDPAQRAREIRDATSDLHSWLGLERHTSVALLEQQAARRDIELPASPLLRMSPAELLASLPAADDPAAAAGLARIEVGLMDLARELSRDDRLRARAPATVKALDFLRAQAEHSDTDLLRLNLCAVVNETVAKTGFESKVTFDCRAKGCAVRWARWPRRGQPVFNASGRTNDAVAKVAPGWVYFWVVLDGAQGKVGKAVLEKIKNQAHGPVVLPGK